MTSPDPGPPPLRLVVLGDSTCFTDDTGPRPPDDAALYPNVAADHLAGLVGRRVEVTVVARAGTTVRDAARTVTKDRHVQFDLLAPADVVVVGIGSFDHAPVGVPPVVEVVVPYLRPAAVRRTARRALHRAYPALVRATGGRRPRTPWSEFERLFSLTLDQIRWLTQGEAAGVVLGPTSHRSPYYAHRHPGFPTAEARHLRLGESHGFATVASWPQVQPDLGALNPDGIHWPRPVHARIGRRLAEVVAPQLRGDAPTIGLPTSRRA